MLDFNHATALTPIGQFVPLLVRLLVSDSGLPHCSIYLYYTLIATKNRGPKKSIFVTYFWDTEQLGHLTAVQSEP